MRESIETKSSAGQTGDARLLVMGFRGRLRAVEGQNLPPAMETLLESWLEQASHLLNQRVPEQHRMFHGEPVPVHSLFPPLKDRLIGILTQALGAIGIHPNESSASDVLRQFPLLSSLMRSAVAEWVAAIATFLQRLHQDQSWLPTAMQLRQLPAIESISAAASDMHSGAHSVVRVCFQGGGCLYYKPRSLTGEWLWHHLLDTIARLDPLLQLPTARVFASHANSTYGWAESVLPKESRFSQSSDEPPAPVVDYWRAAGAMLCLAQFVRLTDLHLANIVATPSGPAVTDAECLATPDLHRSTCGKFSQQPAPFSDAVEAILSTGLLPRKDNADSPDVSGLFGQAAPVSGVRLPAWLLTADRRYRLTSVGAELLDHGNAPAQTSPLAVLPQLVSGYRDTAKLLMRARNSLLAPGSRWLEVLDKLHAPRIVIRNTLSYGCLLSRSLELQYVGSFYRRRNAILSELQSDPSLNLPAAMLRAEMNAILQLHIPRFAVLPGRRSLSTGSGRTLVRRFVASTPAQSVVESIETLSPESIDNLHLPALLAAIL